MNDIKCHVIVYRLECKGLANNLLMASHLIFSNLLKPVKSLCLHQRALDQLNRKIGTSQHCHTMVKTSQKARLCVATKPV